MTEATMECAEAFGHQIIEQEFGAAHELLASWLQDELSPAALELMIEHAREGRPWPAELRVVTNSLTTPDALRTRWEENYGPEPGARNFVRGVPKFGPPSRPIPDEIGENFRGFVHLYFEPSEEDAEEYGADVSFVIWALLVEEDEEQRIGWLEATA
jgi:hypothetical protein